MTYNDINRHRRDELISFEPESHTYRVGDHIYTSVTTLVDDCFEKFDADYWARRKATPECPAAELKRRWDEVGAQARNCGTRLHERIERHYLGLDDLPDDGDRAMDRFREFADRWHLTPYRSEWRIYIEEYRLAGTLDFLAIDDDGELVLWDWKRSNKVVDAMGMPVIDSRWGKHGFAPVDHLPDTSYYHYALQLSIYRYILEQKYDVHPGRARLGIFHPDHPVPYVVEVPYLRHEVISLLHDVAAR